MTLYSEKKRIKNKKYVFVFLLFLLGNLFWNASYARANNYGENEELDNISQVTVEDIAKLDDVEQFLDESNISQHFSFKECLENIKNEGHIDTSAIVKDCIDYLCDEVNEYKKELLIIFGVAILSGISISFFKGTVLEKMSDSSIMIAYMTISVTIIELFSQSYVTTYNTVKLIRDFMRTILPVYTAAMAFSTGSFSSTGYASLTMIIIMSVNLLIFTIVIPICRMYMIVNICSNLMDDNKFSNLAKLFIKTEKFIVKSLILLIGTISVFQKMILPYKDMVARQTILGAIKSVPIAGTTVSGLSDLVFSSALLIRNSVGLTSIIILIIIILLPMIRLFLTLALLNVAAAITQPVTDKKISLLIEGASKAVGMLITALMTSVGLFMVTLALACI